MGQQTGCLPVSDTNNNDEEDIAPCLRSRYVSITLLSKLPRISRRQYNGTGRDSVNLNEGFQQNLKKLSIKLCYRNKVVFLLNP